MGGRGLLVLLLVLVVCSSNVESKNRLKNIAFHQSLCTLNPTNVSLKFSKIIFWVPIIFYFIITLKSYNLVGFGSVEGQTISRVPANFSLFGTQETRMSLGSKQWKYGHP